MSINSRVLPSLKKNSFAALIGSFQTASEIRNSVELWFEGEDERGRLPLTSLFFRFVELFEDLFGEFVEQFLIFF